MDYNRIVFRHLKKFWIDQEITAFSWEFGRILDELPDFTVYRIAPPYDRSHPWVYISSGLGKIINQEFIIVSPTEDSIHVETLAMLASVCFNHKDGYFGLGRVIEIGRPWIDGSNMENFLISLPYPYGEKIEYMGNIRFFWLLPITDKEKEFLDNHKVEELEEKLDEVGINYLSVIRKSVVQ
ncbi:suppressor of fused domain protein [Eikenella corrodens]|uniref:Suppressor of fused domain protein n=1 Tax=Eikenella corrodens TaxID=539 RepID=A0A3S9SJ37_EIKCO|nr:suppressor of fused domain protein [Eikenella corrodens]AZR59517.1 suppressor of fused domain protein [Eikenella corrodens]